MKMKKFKMFFYAVYLISAILVIFMSFNIYESLELFKKIGWYKYFSDLPILVRNLLFFLSTLMLLGFTLAGIFSLMQRRKVSKLEKEIISLKARLFDQSQEKIAEKNTASKQDDENEDEFIKD